MRDVDLVVSVAHRGGVDPEASASTVEMRAALLRETCDLLGLANVARQTPHVLIDASSSNTACTWGVAMSAACPAVRSASSPSTPNTAAASSSPSRQRPQNREVISKALLLSRDEEIQDPTILEQLRR